MTGKEHDWKPIQDLAIQYIRLEKQKEHTDGEDSMESLSKEQNKIAGDIVGGSIKLLYKIAKKMLNSNYAFKVHGKVNFLSLENKGVTIEDLVGEGAIGIYKTLKNFNPELGKISSFIGFNAAGYMYNNTINSIYTVKINPKRHAKIMKLSAKSEKTSEIIAGIMNSHVDIRSAELIYAAFCYSFCEINSPVGSQNNYSGKKNAFTYCDLIASMDHDQHDKYATIERLELQEKLESMMPGLKNDRQRDIIRRRSAFGHPRVDTLKQIADDYHISRERVRQIYNDGLRRFRKFAKHNGLKDYL